jgi:hypothetical protein
MEHKIKRRSFIKKTSAFTLGLGATGSGLVSIASCSGGRELVLAEKGRSQIPIVLAGNASEATRRAGKDLAEYIRKISGARPEVISVPERPPERAVWIGLQPQLAETCPELDLDFQHPEEILIACNGSHLVIAGQDRFFEGTQIEFGTANAVYTFLQDYLDVRWLWPGPLGEDVIRRETIRIPIIEYRYHPQFRQREVFRTFADPRTRDWARFQRNELGSWRIAAGGHAFTDWWERFHEDHPDYFALQPDGTRSGYPNPRTVKLCQSNPQVWDQWLKDAEKRLAENPAMSAVIAAPNDGHSSGVCVCENCRAWDHPEGEPWTYGYEGGHREEYVAMTDRYITFWNHLARLLKEHFPDREVYLRTGAYGPSTPIPVKAVLEDNIVHAYVGKFPLTCEMSEHKYPVQGRQQQRAEFMEWAKRAQTLLYRPNLWYWGGGVWGLPEITLRKTMEDLRFIAEYRCKGLIIDTARGHWATQGPMYYLMAQMAWDPYLDGEALLKDYYSRGFGKAAGPVEEYWNLLEQTNLALVESPEFNPRPMVSTGLVESFPRFYDNEFFNKADELLKQAFEMTEGEPEIYRERVAFLQTGLDFTRLMLDAIKMMKKVRESGGKDKNAVEKAAEIWKEIDALCTESGPFAINLGLDPQSRFRGKVIDYLGPPSEELRKAAGLGG